MGEENGTKRRPDLRLIQGGAQGRPTGWGQWHQPLRSSEQGTTAPAPLRGVESAPSDASSLRRGWLYVEYSNGGNADAPAQFMARPSLAEYDPSGQPQQVLEPSGEVRDPYLRSVISVADANCTVPLGIAGSVGQQYVVLHKERSAAGAKPTQPVYGKMHLRDERRFSLGVAALDLFPEVINGGMLNHLDYVHKRFAHGAQEHQLATPQGLEDKRWLEIPRFRQAFSAMIDSFFNGQSSRGELPVPLYNKADAISITVGSLALLEMLYGSRPVLVARSEDSNGMEQLEQQAAHLGGVLVRLRPEFHGDHMATQQQAPSSAFGKWLLDRMSTATGITALQQRLTALPEHHQPRLSLVERLDALYNTDRITDEEIHRIAEQYRQHCYEQEQRGLIEKIRGAYALFVTVKEALQTLERHYNAPHRRLFKEKRAYIYSSVPALADMEYEPGIRGLQEHLNNLDSAMIVMMRQITNEDDSLLRTKYRINLPPA